MPNLSLQIHPSIRGTEVPQMIDIEVENQTIVNAIIQALDPFTELKATLIDGTRLKPGLLVFSDKTELTSMGLLETMLDENLKIRIVPILHGG